MLIHLLRCFQNWARASNLLDTFSGTEEKVPTPCKSAGCTASKDPQRELLRDLLGQWRRNNYDRRYFIINLTSRRYSKQSSLSLLKIKHGLVLYCVSNLYVRKGSPHSPRNSDFVLLRFRTIRYGKHFVRYLGPFLWTKLTENKSGSPSLPVFIKKNKKTEPCRHCN